MKCEKDSYKEEEEGEGKCGVTEMSFFGFEKTGGSIGLIAVFDVCNG
jgi:hypothetical protein